MTITMKVVDANTSVVMGLTANNWGVNLVPGSGGGMVLEYTTQKSPRLSHDSSVSWTTWPFGTVTQAKAGILLPQVTGIRVSATSAAGMFSLDDSPGAIWGSEALAVSELENAKLYTTTTNNTPKVMSLDGTVAAAANQILLPQDSTFGFDIILAARRTDANVESATYRHTGCIDRGVLASTTALVGSVTKAIVAEDTAGWDSAVTADVTLGGITLTVTGTNGSTIKWVARVSLIEITG